MNNHYKYLADKWTTKHRQLQDNLIKKHKASFERLSASSKQLAVSSLGSLMLLTAPMQKDAITNRVEVAGQEAQSVDSKVFLIADLASALPPDVGPLDAAQESKVSDILSKTYGVKTFLEENGMRLNRSYGLIGAEQHLARYPGDSMGAHFDNSEDAVKFSAQGMAPGLGAWGYFATSASQMTKEDSEREKYYLAVQTFLSPNFNQRVAEYRDFYRFRKMLVVNPQNGKALVAVIGDAGPAEWTGKHLGGSPEVMSYLERFDGSARGPVLYYFIDDPNDTIPLGPINPVQ